MTEHMKTFTMLDIGKTDIVEKPIPAPGPNEALVKTTASLICTSDVHTSKVRCRWRTAGPWATSPSG
ncbi:NADP-dependent alcohol dehydrogenase [Gordonia bronchialis]|uniref:hypothetical protein n=1 Tax=Gordonia bronchialis TaxID=2054 RepID=UPI000DFC2A7D|nr:hypothetical protein [Gordonia bronchialis]MCC3322219.1 hypothetical protein [Gordonia bronchialis]STQ62194.1 NADP-dependent alcohol dehydrogenase [Gordonia bronchialis]